MPACWVGKWFCSWVGEPVGSQSFWTLEKKAWAKQGSGLWVWKRWKLQLEVGEGRLGGRRSDVTTARRFRSPAPERMTSSSVGLELGCCDPREPTIAPPQPGSLPAPASHRRLGPWPPTRGLWRWTSRRRRPSRWVGFSRKRVRGSVLAGDHSWIGHSLFWSGRVWGACEDGAWTLNWLCLSIRLLGYIRAGECSHGWRAQPPVFRESRLIVDCCTLPTWIIITFVSFSTSGFWAS